MKAPSPYPLHWPDGWTRTPADRRPARFMRRDAGATYGSRNLTVNDALNRLDLEVERLVDAHNVVVSTNVLVRIDGRPRSSASEPDDPAVAVYFKRHGTDHVLACDRWNRVADNLAAVAKHIEALRGMDRWGVGDLARAFAGYRALPPGSGETAPAPRPWWEVLGFDSPDGVGPKTAREAFRRLSRDNHPDRGGSEERMAEITRAYKEFQDT